MKQNVLPQFRLLDPDLDVGYLYEFVVKFSNDLHLNISFN